MARSATPDFRRALCENAAQKRGASDEACAAQPVRMLARPMRVYERGDAARLTHAKPRYVIYRFV